MKSLRLLALLALGLLFAVEGHAQHIPPNATKNQYGPGWACNQDFYRVGNRCEPVIVPENGQMNLLRNGWVCKRGYFKAGQKCDPVQIPPNARLSVTGNDWVCNRGYTRKGVVCSEVTVPQNGSLNVLGNDWVCDKGYRKSGAKCVVVTIPPNASLSITGNDWVCNNGFVRQGAGCREMSAAERKRQADLLKKFEDQQKLRRAAQLAGRDCEVEYQSGANVCVTVSDTELSCSEAFGGGHYRSCDVEIDYTLETDYRGRSSLDVQIECEATLSTSGKYSISGSENESDTDSAVMFAGGYETGRIDLSFSLGTFSEITRVRLDEAVCRIDNVFLY